MPHAEINVPGLILVGRFSADPHWPVLGDPRGRYLRGLVPHIVYSSSYRIRNILLDCFKLYRKKRESLHNVIVQVSANPSTFLLLCFH